MTTIVDPVVSSFVHSLSLETRLQVSNKIKELYPDCVPVLVGKGETKTTPSTPKNKIVVSADARFGSFAHGIRKSIPGIDSHTAIIFFVNGVVICPSSTLQELYDKYKSADGFLYVTYTCENTFG